MSADEPDLNTANNTSSEQTSVVEVAADLSVGKFDFQDPVDVGGQLTYRVNVHNFGPADATGVEVTDTLPPGTIFSSATTPCSHSAGTVTCDLGTITRFTSESVDIVVTAPATPTPPGEPLSNTADVTSSSPDPNLTNNSATDTTAVRRFGNLSLTKEAAPDPAIAGEPLTYTLTASNAGPQTASDVTLTDDLPTSFSFTEATSSQGTCLEDAGTVTCELGAIASGADATVEIEGVPTAAQPLSNQALVVSNADTDHDPDPFDNDAFLTTNVRWARDVAVSKVDAPDPIYVGENTTYTVSVVNLGANPLTGVVATDTLPAGMTFVSSPTCTAAADVVTCAFGDLASGQEKNATIVAQRDDQPHEDEHDLGDGRGRRPEPVQQHCRPPNARTRHGIRHRAGDDRGRDVALGRVVRLDSAERQPQRRRDDIARRLPAARLDLRPADERRRGDRRQRQHRRGLRRGRRRGERARRHRLRRHRPQARPRRTRRDELRLAQLPLPVRGVPGVHRQRVQRRLHRRGRQLDWSTAGSTITAPGNFAFDPDGNAISVNSLGFTTLTAGQAAGTTYDGATPVLSASHTITPGAHSLFLSILDQGDHTFDSAVQVDRVRLSSVPAESCTPGATILSTTKVADSPTTPSGGTNGYTISIANPHTAPFTLSAITDDLPEGFSYVAGFDDGHDDERSDDHGSASDVARAVRPSRQEGA